MKGEDIDKLFRDKLSGSVEPTTDQDWAAFEAGLDKPAAWYSSRYFGLAALLLIGSFGAAYYFGAFTSEPNKELASNQNKLENSHSGIEQKAEEASFQKQTELSISEIGENENLVSDHDSNSSASTGVDYLSNDFSNDENSSFTMNAEVGSKDANTSADLTSSQKVNTTNGAKSNSENINGQLSLDKEEQNGESLDKQKIGTSTAASPNHSMPQKEGNSEVITKNSTNGQLASEDFGKSLGLGSGASTREKQGIEVLTLTEMNSLDGLIDIDLDSKQMKSSIQELAVSNFSKIHPFIYLKGEQNLVLETSFGLGVGMEYQFSDSKNWTRNLSLSAAVGYLRSGALSWEQESEFITYGFDQYSEERKLTTERLDLLQIPLHLNYNFAGVHSVFAGLESSFLLKATQDFVLLSNSDEGGNSESGYLYDADTPNYIYFFQLGYGYGINERYKIQIGGSLSNQTWNPSPNRALGVFIKLNYHIR